MLNRVSLILSVVGLVSKPSGAFNGKLLAVPAMTLMYFSPIYALTLTPLESLEPSFRLFRTKFFPLYSILVSTAFFV